MAGNAFVRGGQVVVHGWTMLGQIAKLTSKIAILVMIAVVIVSFLFFHARNQNITHGALLYAKTNTVYIFSTNSKKIAYTQPDGREINVSIGQIRNNPALKSAFHEVLGHIYFASKIGGGAGAGIAILLWMFFRRRGKKIIAKKHIKGSRLVSGAELDSAVQFKCKGNTRYSLADISWPTGDEQKHTLIVGTTGSGKTVAMMDLLEQIEKQGDRAIVYDKLGSFIPHFYTPGRDVILNPFDKRSADWCLFSEATAPYDFTSIAAALLPEFKDTADPFWIAAARQLFSSGAAAMWEAGDWDMKKLTHRLLKMDLEDLAVLMKDTPSSGIVDAENAKVTLSVRSVLSTHISPLEFLRKPRERFSVREWVQDESQSGFLFLSSHAATHEARRAQIATQIELALIALLSAPRDPERRFWILIDELPSLQKIPSLVSGLREIRNAGGCFCIATQVFSELRDLYGREAAASISGNCNTRLVLSSPDKETAEWMSAGLGRELTQRMNQSFSYGADSIRDGVSHTMREDAHPIVFPADIMRLPVLEGYIKMPHDLPVAKVDLTPKARFDRADAFVPLDKPKPIKKLTEQIDESREEMIEFVKQPPPVNRTGTPAKKKEKEKQEPMLTEKMAEMFAREKPAKSKKSAKRSERIEPIVDSPLPEQQNPEADTPPEPIDGYFEEEQNKPDMDAIKQDDKVAVPLLNGVSAPIQKKKKRKRNKKKPAKDNAPASGDESVPPDSNAECQSEQKQSSTAKPVMQKSNPAATSSEAQRGGVLGIFEG